ncbi:hypothetical protein GGQ85_003422 [Nitrobacter vulgaris]|nr:hypothetical protein [Nitrobacter vulgaris]
MSVRADLHADISAKNTKLNNEMRVAGSPTHLLHKMIVSLSGIYPGTQISARRCPSWICAGASSYPCRAHIP